ncbi:MAG TPA: hypothetical protein VH041_01550 [Caldimonas sp.]|nr:hypothetical protein [Caldimonas sp.]HEX4232966.1 hypothetical protein [Caldimonas sp.]
MRTLVGDRHRERLGCIDQLFELVAETAGANHAQPRDLLRGLLRRADEFRITDQDGAARVAEDVGGVGRRDSRIERDQRCAGERNRAVRRQHDVRISSEHRDAIARRHPLCLQSTGEFQATPKELPVGEASLAVADADAITVDARRPTQERGGCQGLEAESCRLLCGAHRCLSAVPCVRLERRRRPDCSAGAATCTRCDHEAAPENP